MLGPVNVALQLNAIKLDADRIISASNDAEGKNDMPETADKEPMPFNNAVVAKETVPLALNSPAPLIVALAPNESDAAA